MTSAATTGSGLTDYDKGYLDGLLSGTASAGGKWTDEYEKKAKAYLTERGFKGWKVNAATTLDVERDLIEELGKAASTFSDLRVALELLHHDTMAMACGVAEEHIRSVIEEANRARYAR